MVGRCDATPSIRRAITVANYNRSGMDKTKTISLILLLLAMLSGCALQQSEPPTQVFENMHDGGTVLAFNTDESLLASGGKGGWVHLYHLPYTGHIDSWQAHEGSTVNGLVFDGQTLLTAGYDARLVRWTLQGTIVQQVITPSPVTHMAYDELRKRLITGHRDGVVRLWHSDDLSLLTEYPLHSGAVKRVAVQEKSGLLASSGSDGRVFLITSEGARELPHPPSNAAALVFAADDQTLYGSGWFKLFRWDLESATLALLDTPHHGIIKALYWIPETSQLASISQQTDSSIYYLDPATGAATRSFEKHALCGAAVQVSPTARYLATTSDDASVKLWDLQH